METFRLRSVFLRWDPNDVTHCRILPTVCHRQDYTVVCLNYTLQTMMPLPGWPFMAPNAYDNNNNCVYSLECRVFHCYNCLMMLFPLFFIWSLTSLLPIIIHECMHDTDMMKMYTKLPHHVYLNVHWTNSSATACLNIFLKSRQASYGWLHYTVEHYFFAAS